MLGFVKNESGRRSCALPIKNAGIAELQSADGAVWLADQIGLAHYRAGGIGRVTHSPPARLCDIATIAKTERGHHSRKLLKKRI
jgi:hypothetical protein